MHVGEVLFLQPKFAIVFFINGIGTYLIGPVEPYHGIDAFVDGAGKYETSIIVGVFANKVDTAWGSVGNTLVSKALLKKRF